MRTVNILSLLLFALLKCHIGYALNCNTCAGDCADNKVMPCEPNQVCMIREVHINGVRQAQQKGCMNKDMCHTSSEMEGMKLWCCDTDGCNTEIPKPGTTSPPQNLTCYSCGYMCFRKDAIVCPEKQVCVTKTTKMAGMPYKSRGCANSSVCSTYTTETVLETQMSVMNECCDGNLCNSAATLRLPLLAAIGALLFLWIVKLS